MLTKNRCSVKVFIQTNVLEVKVMFNKYKNKLLTNIAVVSISCVVFIVFFMNLYHNAQMEQLTILFLKRQLLKMIIRT